MKYSLFLREPPCQILVFIHITRVMVWQDIKNKIKNMLDANYRNLYLSVQRSNYQYYQEVYVKSRTSIGMSKCV